MSFSHNETRALAIKAARGAGYSWGVADEAAEAVCWLCAHGLDGCGALANLLQSQTENRASAAHLCSVTTGCNLLDARADFAASVARTVVAPELLLPFVHMMARDLGRILTVTSLQWTFLTNGRATAMREGDPTLDLGMIRLQRVDELVELHEPQRQSRVHCDNETWQTLTEFAAKTYAPSTEQSRLTGAGAGVSDND